MALIFIVLGLLGFGLYRFIYSPKIEMINSLRDKVNAIQRELTIAMSKKGKFSKISEEERMEWRDIEDNIKKIFPPDEEYPKDVTIFVKEGIYIGDNLLLRERPPALFEDIIAVARASNILTSIKLKKKGAKKTFNKDKVRWIIKNFELSFECNYVELLSFLKRIKGIDRLIIIDSLKVSRGRIPLVNVFMTINVFYS